MSQTASAVAATSKGRGGDDGCVRLINNLSVLDPILQFLTKATGHPLVPLSTLRKALPGPRASSVLESIPELSRRGILRVSSKRQRVRTSERDGGERGECAATTVDDTSTLADIGTDELYSRFIGEQDNDSDLPVYVGFFSRPGHFNGDTSTGGSNGQGVGGGASALHGSTKAGAKRRLTALKKSLKADLKTKKRSTKIKKKKNITGEGGNNEADTSTNQLNEMNETDLLNEEAGEEDDVVSPIVPVGDSSEMGTGSKSSSENTEETRLARNDSDQVSQEEQDAFLCLRKMLGLEKKCSDDGKVSSLCESHAEELLPNQAMFAGCSPARQEQYQSLSESTRNLLPSVLVDALGLDIDQDKSKADDACAESNKRRRLYSHQSIAVESILNGVHTAICTGTGSGKSLCFLLPVLATVLNTDISALAATSCPSDVQGNVAAIVMFPTKALAQDQYTKLLSLVKFHPLLMDHIRPGVIDGDTPHQNRSDIAKNCNLILTNPDTIHAAILPNWKRTYSPLLQRVKYVVLDESHMYAGCFGAHVALVLSRLVRVCAAAYYTSKEMDAKQDKIVFVACSATMGRPEEHFRLLCPIGDEAATIVNAGDDGSPCAAKYFFTWNPPLLNQEGNTTGRLVVPRPKQSKQPHAASKRDRKIPNSTKACSADYAFAEKIGTANTSAKSKGANNRHCPMHRRHAADETARLLAESVRNGVRCIAFCKTRSLCEWVYERCVATLRSCSGGGPDLSSKVESYRGGYAAEARRSIEARLFREELLGVVATSALELGVDIGGIDLTLHCGYPGSISSLMQQSGRAGRGGKPSVSIMICFASPAEQHFWRFPKSLLSRGLDAPPSVPINVGILQGHLLCAGEEYPLVGDHSVATLLTSAWEDPQRSNLTDRKLFSGHIYDEVHEKLMQDGLLCESPVQLRTSTTLLAYSTHPSVSRPWSRVSLRSIEPISYSIVDINHKLQGGQTDTIKERAVMDSIPYSRVFYHAFPGAVIMHRGRRYKVESMNSPPPFADCSIGYCRSIKLGAFAKRTSVTYSTRAVALTHITVVKQFDRIELLPGRRKEEDGLSSSPPAAKSDQDGELSTAKMANRLYKCPELHCGSIAGSGVVTIKRTVHGYKRLSPVNRVEISRHELKMPSMEYDTNAIWFDVEAGLLSGVVIDFDAGVHALSHALLAVAPLFVPCTSSDIDCDHSKQECTRVMLFDSRAGGAGITSRLWKHFFRPNGMLLSAIELLSYCSTCSDDSGFKGGCPGCLQSVPCINFHEDLSRTAGLYIARRLLKRVEQTDVYRRNVQKAEIQTSGSTQPSMPSTPEKTAIDNNSDTPRRAARKRALRFARDLESAKKRSVVVGRPTWPADERL